LKIGLLQTSAALQKLSTTNTSGEKPTKSDVQ